MILAIVITLLMMAAVVWGPGVFLATLLPGFICVGIWRDVQLWRRIKANR